VKFVVQFDNDKTYFRNKTIYLHAYCEFLIHNITAKAALKFGSEAWVLKKREEQCSEASQMKFLRHLLELTKLDKEKN